MPEIGEIRRGAEIGYKDRKGHIWAACPDCGETRWIVMAKVSETNSDEVVATSGPGKIHIDELHPETRKKLGLDEEKPTAESGKIPKKPDRGAGRKATAKYYEKNKEAILADYESMLLMDFFGKWGINSNKWMKLKALWKIPGKISRREYIPSSPSPDTHRVIPKSTEYWEGYRQAVLDMSPK